LIRTRYFVVVLFAPFAPCCLQGCIQQTVLIYTRAQFNVVNADFDRNSTAFLTCYFLL